jgi:hypothetical protein
MGNLGWSKLAIGAKRKFVELVKSCPVDMNGISTKEDLNILPLGSYEYLRAVKYQGRFEHPSLGISTMLS